MAELSLAQLQTLINSVNTTITNDINNNIRPNGTSRVFATSTQISDWNSKAAGVHTHTKAQITDFAHTHPGTDITSVVANATLAVTANNIPESDVGGNIWISVTSGAGGGQASTGSMGSTTAPTSPVVNQIWFDVTNRLVKYWNGSAWVAFGAVYF
jgi:hypothetical protein